MVAKITLKKSKGIPIVALAASNPIMVKNWANNPKMEAKKIFNIDFGEGNIAKWQYGKNKNIQLYKKIPRSETFFPFVFCNRSGFYIVSSRRESFI